MDGEAENAATISGAQRKGQRSYSTARRMEDNSLQRFGETFGGQEEMYLAQLKGRQENSQETNQAFTQVIRKLTDSAYAGMPEQPRNRIARDHFLETLRDREVRSAVHLVRPATMEEAVRSALETEAFLATERQRYP